MRTRAILLVVAVAFATFIPIARAGAGGFCMGHTSAERFTDTDGTEVSMADYCFSPIVLRIGAGDTVTFANDDKEVHAVGGAVGTFGDAHEEIAPGDSMAYRFDREGTFPYVCIYHPGMAGAVVVGDGEGPAFKAGGIVPAAPDDTEGGNASGSVEPPSAPTGAESSEPTPWFLIVGSLVAAGLAALVVGRGRRSHIEPTPWSS